MSQTNKYLTDTAPWVLIKDAENNDRVQRIIYNAAEACRVVGILLQPYMPGKAKELLDMLGVADSYRTFQHAAYGGDVRYGVARISIGKGAYDGLFPPLTLED